MKKFFVLACSVFVGFSVCMAVESPATASHSSLVEIATEASVPTGLFKNGSDFIIVKDGWLRIVVGGSMSEYNYSVEIDPWGNYILKFNGESATLASNGSSIYYNGVTYKK